MSEYQKVVLGQILQDNDVYHECGLSADHFTDRWCRTVFETIENLIENGQPANIVTVTQANTVPRREEIAGLTDLAPSSAWGFYVKQVKAEAKRNYLEKALMSATELLKTGSDTDSVLSQIEDELVRIAMTGQEEVRFLSEEVGPFIQEIERRHKAKGNIPGIPTGFPTVDTITGGLEPKMLWYLGARPSQGKSTLLVNMLSNVAAKGYSVGWLSIESSSLEGMTRIFSSIGNIRKDHLRMGTVLPADFQRMGDTGEELTKWKVWVCDDAEMTLSQLKAVARKMVIAHKVDALFVDYLQYIRPDRENADRKDQVAIASRSLKSLARQLNVPVVCAAQLRREVEDRRNSRPRLSDFAESSQIEKDADVALLLYNDEYFCVEKNRDGKTDDVKVMFNKDYARFEEKV